MKNLIVIANVLAISYFNAQTPIQSEAYKVPGFSSTLINNKVINANGLDPNIEGSPYLYDDYKLTQVSNSPEGFTGRYNIYTDEIELKRNNDVFVLPKDSNYTVITLKPNTKILLINDKYYLVVKEYNNFTVLRKDKINFQKGRESRNGYESSKLAVYKKDNATYFIKKDEELLLLDKKSDFAKIFPEKNVNDFIKSQKVNFKDESLILKLTDFLNQ